MFFGQHPFPGQNGQISLIACFGVSKQAIHRRPGDEPFFTLGSNVNGWRGWQKNGPFWTKNGQIWQACQCSKVIQKGPKRSRHQHKCFWPFCTPLDPSGPFLTISNKKWFFCSEAPQLNPTLFIWGNKFIFVWNGPKGSEMVKNHSGWLFWSLLDYFGQACHFWSIMDHFLADPSQERWTYPSLLWLAELK